MKWAPTLLLCALLAALDSLGSDFQFKISRFRSDEIATVTFNSSIDISEVQLFLLASNEIDTLAHFKSYFHESLDSIKRIRFSNDYLIIDRHEESNARLYDYVKYDTMAFKGGFWVVGLKEKNGKEHAINKMGPLFWEGHTPNKLDLNNVETEATYSGFVGAGIEYGAMAFEGADAPQLQSYTIGEHHLEAFKTPVILSYRLHSAHSDIRRLNYLRFDLNTAEIKRRAREKYIEDQLERVDSFNLQETVELKKNKYLNSARAEIEKRANELKDSLEQLKMSLSDSIETVAKQTLDSSELVDKNRELEARYAQRRAELNSKKDEIDRQLSTVSSEIERTQSRVDSLKALRNSYNDYLTRPKGDIIDEGLILDEINKKKQKLIQKVTGNLDEFKLGRHLIHGGQLGGSMSIRGGTVGYKLGRTTITMSNGKTVIPVNDSFFTPLIHAQSNTLVKVSYKVQKYEIGALAYLGTGEIDQSRSFTKPLTDVFFRINETNFDLAAEVSGSKEMIEGDKNWDFEDFYNSTPISISTVMNFHLLSNSLVLEWQNKSVDEGYRGIGLFQGYSGYKEYRAGLSFELLSGRVSGRTFMQLFQDNAIENQSRNQLGAELLLRPINALSIQTRYYPNRTGVQWFDRAAVLRQNLFETSTQINVQLFGMSMMNMVSLQRFTMSGESNQFNNNLNFFSTAALRSLNLQYNYVRNFGSNDDSFSAHQVSVGLSDLLGFIVASSSYMRQYGSEGISQRVTIDLQADLKGWNLSCAYSLFDQTDENSWRQPVSWNFSLTKKLSAKPLAKGRI